MRDKIAKQYLLTIILVFLLLFIMLVYIFSSFYRTSVSNIRELGVKNIKSEAAMIETYMTKSMDVLWATADTVNYLMEEGASSEEILGYLTKEAEHAAKQVDENFTGIYGYIDGQYLDGIGWVPPADYEPTERVWYTKAKEAGGQIALVPPYLDAQTGTVMFSVSQLLSDGESVVSIDVTLNEVQAITENMTLNEIGYGFVMDGTGLVIAHVDEAEKGKDYPTNEKQEYLLSKVFEGEQEYFDMDIDGEACTVFSEQVMEDWYVVMVVQNTLLFSELTMQMCIGIIVSALVFLCIALFLVISAKNIREFQRKERESRERLDELNTNIIRALAYTIDAKDRYTSGHSQRVADYALAIAKRMGKTEEEQKIIYYAGLLHDIGKIRVPEELINKPGGLTEDEFNQIRVHPVSGYHILKDIHEDIRIAYGAKYHHERYDGKGYPNALEGENIPEIARIIGVADSYDAMASDRRYRDALPQEVIRSEFEKGRGTQFDKEIADIMIQMIDEDKDYTMRQSGRSTKNILVVDDEMMNIKMVEFIFRDTSDFHVFGVENMEETFELLEKQEIHLILLDLKMPDIDGFELYQMIVERYRIPVVLMTADKSIETIQKINELGIDDYVTKPLNAFVVRETVHGIVNSWGSV
ncbi:MAG: response regulator [Agathobacter sp.]|nr:response regulator [Agathobacter sp.]MDY3889256.1 response regulator [Agathobacter sp.]